MVARDVNELHAVNGINRMTALTEKKTKINGRAESPNQHDILTGSRPDGTASTESGDTTCSNWTSSDKGSALVGHHDRWGLQYTDQAMSWNSSHGSKGCSQPALVSTGGAGLLYCFAADTGGMAKAEAPKKAKKKVSSRLSDRPRLRQPAPFLVVADSLLDLLARIHHERAVLHDGLVQRASGEQYEARAFRACLDLDAVPAGEHACAVGLERPGRTGRTGLDTAFVDVDECVMAGWNRVRKRCVRRQFHVEVERLGAEALHRAG